MKLRIIDSGRWYGYRALGEEKRRKNLKTLLVFSLGVALIMAPLTSTSAHVGDIIFPIYEIPTADLPNLHDGTLEDWEEILPNASLNYTDFAYNGGIGGGMDSADLAFQVFLAWHSATQRIYVAIERRDDVYASPFEGSVLISVDGDHSGGPFFYGQEYSEEEIKRLNYAQAQTYSVQAEVYNGDPLSFLGIGSEVLTWTTRLPWAEIGGYHSGNSPHFWTTELAVTLWDDLDWHGHELSQRSMLDAGKVIGFQIEVFDFDEAFKMQGDYLLGLPEKDPMGQPGIWADNFVDGELIPCNWGDCGTVREVSAVKADAWGRIKASFR